MPVSARRFNGSLEIRRGLHPRLSADSSRLRAVVLAERRLFARGADAVGVGDEGGLLRLLRATQAALALAVLPLGAPLFGELLGAIAQCLCIRNVRHMASTRTAM